MSLLNHLEFQPIDRFSEIPDSHTHDFGDDIDLTESIDDDKLEKFWDQVVSDIHDDPEWFTFDND